MGPALWPDLRQYGEGTTAVTRTVGKGKTVVWRWQERFMHEGVEGLARDKTRLCLPIMPSEHSTDGDRRAK